jgi:predicted amidohydrolase YtcJ
VDGRQGDDSHTRKPGWGELVTQARLNVSSKLLLVNGVIYTFDPAVPRAQSVAILGTRIAAVGDSDELRHLATGGNWQIVDLGGRPVLPGFTDCHIHLLRYALSAVDLPLFDMPCKQEVLAAVAERASQLRPGEWVRGLGWSDAGWGPEVRPVKEDLDKVAPENPVDLAKKDGHTHWVNSLALRLAGIDAQTSDPVGGRIERDETTGQPTGILREKAIDLFHEVVPTSDTQTRQQVVQRAICNLQRMGLTGIHDCGLDAAESLSVLQQLLASGGLGVRVLWMIPDQGLHDALSLGLRSGFGNDYIRVGHVKLFADGSLGSQSADMLEPLEGQPENRGISVTEQPELDELVRCASDGGICCAVHAIGDRANRRVLDAFDRYRQEHQTVRLRHRIEHAQLLHPMDIPRFKELCVAASMQPIHAVSDMSLADRYWGQRARWSYAWRSLLEAGATLAFGSDAPVESPDPLLGIHAAATRQRTSGEPEGGWHPEERLSVSAAVQAYTIGAAYASGDEKERGSISPGKLADLVVLSRDIFQMHPREIVDTKVMATVFDGAFVYKHDSW